MIIKWNRLAVKQLLEIIQYLEENEQLGYAEKIEKEILEKIRKLSSNSDLYPSDRLKRHNDGKFRAFEVDSYRISYKKSASEIRILRIRHTARRPFTR